MKKIILKTVVLWIAFMAFATGAMAQEKEMWLTGDKSFFLMNIANIDSIIFEPIISDPNVVYSISATQLQPFGSVHQPYSQPAAQIVTVTNTGTMPVTLTQPVAANYIIGALSQAYLTAGQTATFTVQPKAGLPVNVYNETIAITGTNSANATVSATFNISARTADPYPVKNVVNSNRPLDGGQWNTFSLSGYAEHLMGIYATEDDIPYDLRKAVAVLGLGIVWNKNMGVVSDNATAEHDISDVVLHEYTNWYQPVGPLTVTLTDINTTSVTTWVTTTLGFNAAYQGIGVSGSIKKEVGTTIQNIQGVQVTQTWDLREYDQSKMYKVVLVGKMTGIKHNFSAEYIGTWSSHNMHETLHTVTIDQSSLTVKLVHN